VTLAEVGAAADALVGGLEALRATALSTSLRESRWLYPAVETTHLLGLALLVGSAAAFDLRLLGASRRLPVTVAARHLLPCAWAGFAAAGLSGALLFAAEPVETAANPAFRVKLALLAAAGLNAAAFHRGPFRRVAAWDDGVPPRAARLAAAASLALWAAVVAAGRLIAYV
jgi:hypothetical protein